jgi:EmrB/QacA subfamily drug resistance transporter
MTAITEFRGPPAGRVPASQPSRQSPPAEHRPAGPATARPDSPGRRQLRNPGTGQPGRGWTLAVVSAAAFMLMLDITVVNVALPGIRRSLGASFTDLQWVLDADALTLAIFLLTAGSLGDAWGRKRMFIAGFAAFTAASLAAGLAGSALELNLARAAEGAGGAVLYAVGPALIGQEFRGRQRGMAFGIFGGVSGLAIAVGPLAGGALTGSLGWRWIFLINVPVGAAAMALAWWRLRDSKNRGAAGVDWAGMAAFSTALGLLVFALIRGGSLGWRSPVTLALFAGAAASLAGFAFIERGRGPAAMFDLSLLRNRTFNGVSAVALLSNAAVLPAIFLEVSYVQNVRGFSALQTGERFLPLTLMLFAMGAVAGSLTSRVAPRLLLGTSLLLIAAGTAMFAVAGKQGAWTALIPSMIVTGAGMGISNPVRAATAIGVAGPERAGMTSGISETFQQTGVAVGIAAIGAFFQARVTARFHPAAGAGSPATTRLAGKAVAAGNLHDVTARLPARAAAAVNQAAGHAFTAGLHDALLAAAAIALAGAAAGFLAIRRRDLDSSALTAVPAETSPDEPLTGTPPAAITAPQGPPERKAASSHAC